MLNILSVCEMLVLLHRVLVKSFHRAHEELKGHKIKNYQIMGKSKPGLFTPVTGKVGGVVYYYRNGRQVQRILVRPSNPQSKRQVDTRLKFSLAGKLSSIVPWEALEGLPGSKTERRGLFNRNIMINSTVTEGSAGIPYGDIVFSDGVTPVFCNHYAVVSGSSLESVVRSVTITSSLSSGTTLPEGYGERYVVLFLNTGTSQFDYATTGYLNLPTGSEGGQSATTAAGVRVGDKSASYVALVYVCPFIAEGVDGNFAVSYIGTEDGTVVVDKLGGEVLGRLVYGRSLFIGSYDIVPSNS